MSKTGEKKRRVFRTRRAPVGASPGTLIADPSAEPTRLTLTLISAAKSKTIRKATIGG